MARGLRFMMEERSDDEGRRSASRNARDGLRRECIDSTVSSRPGTVAAVSGVRDSGRNRGRDTYSHSYLGPDCGPIRTAIAHAD